MLHYVAPVCRPIRNVQSSIYIGVPCFTTLVCVIIYTRIVCTTILVYLVFISNFTCCVGTLWNLSSLFKLSVKRHFPHYAGLDEPTPGYSD